MIELNLSSSTGNRMRALQTFSAFAFFGRGQLSLLASFIKACLGQRAGSIGSGCG